MLKESSLSLTLVLIYFLDLWMKIKRCGEMARKLRFFKDQMSKAGVSPKEFLGNDVDIDLDDVEVNTAFVFFFLDSHLFLFVSCL